MGVADLLLGFERSENDGGWLYGLLRSVEVVSEEETGQKCSVVPGVVKRFTGEKVPKDELGLQMRDPLVSHDEVNLTADMLAESCRVGVKVRSTNACRDMVLEVIVIDQVKGGLGDRFDPYAAGKDHEVGQSGIQDLAIVFKACDAVQFVRITLKPSLSKSRIDVVVGVTVSCSIGVADGEGRFPSPVEYLREPDVDCLTSYALTSV